MKRSEMLVENLGLQAHPEGGFYLETYRSAESMDLKRGSRNVCTAIYFMLLDDNFSAFHRIASDEIWHHYEGECLEIFVLDENGGLEVIQLGKEWERGERPQYTVAAGRWFASRVRKSSGYALVGCTVAPGFDFLDFEMADREVLLQNYPQHEEIIRSLTRA